MKLIASTVLVLVFCLATVSLAQDESEFEVGSVVTIAADIPVLFVYTEPSYDADVLEAALGGTTVTVLGGPEETDGDIWWQIRTVSDTEGWVPLFQDGVQTLVGDELSRTALATATPTAVTSGNTSAPPSSELSVGDTVVIGGQGRVVTIHAEPDDDADIVEAVVSGFSLDIVGEAEEVEGVIWWEVESVSGNRGWVPSMVDGAPTFTGPSRMTGSGNVIAIGADVTVIVEGFLLVYAEPSLASEVIEAKTSGLTVTVLDGPQMSDEGTWWQVQTLGGVDGWVLEQADGTPILFAPSMLTTETPTPLPTSIPTPIPEPATEIACDTQGMQIVATAGDVAVVSCPAGCSAGSLWGTDIYTDDSSVCTAAAHAGVITLSEGGNVEVTYVQGQQQYSGSQRNEVGSSDWGSWDGSFSLEAP
jgi:hypothetical protein